MREIKFRAWDSKAGFFVNPSQVFINLEGYVCAESEDDGTVCAFSNQDALIIEQFTGLLDENGNEIYDGDILHGREEGDGETTAWTDVYFQIFYNEDIASFMAHEIGSWNPSWDEQICELTTDYQVIGNIHENPEKLGKKHE